MSLEENNNSKFLDIICEEIRSYKRLRRWIYSLLDQFRQELQPILFPIYLHSYIYLVKECEAGIITEEEVENIFEDSTNEEFYLKGNSKNISIKRIPKIFLVFFNDFDFKNTAYSTDTIRTDVFFQKFLNERYPISINKHAFTLLLAFLEEKKMSKILSIINERIEIKKGASKQNLFSMGNMNTECDLFSPLAERLYFNRDIEGEERSMSASRLNVELKNIADYYNRNNSLNILCHSIRSKDVSTVAISNCGKLVIVGFNSGLISVARDNKIYNLIGHCGPVFSLAISYSLKSLVSGGIDGEIRHWNLDLNRTVALYKVNFPVYAIEISKYDEYFLVGGQMGYSLLYSFVKQTPIRIFTNSLKNISLERNEKLVCSPTAPSTLISSVAFHPNTLYVAMGSLCEVSIFDIEHGNCIRQFSVSDYATALAFSHDGKLLAVGLKNGNILLYDIVPSVLTELKNIKNVIYDIKFSNSNEYIIIGHKKIGLFYLKEKRYEEYGTNSEGFSVGFGFGNTINVIGINSK